MSTSTTNYALTRSRSMRVPPANTLKLPTTTTPIAPVSGPSNVTLFLTNLRLLNLDLRSDWPNINAVTFSTKDTQQNQKKRIQCVEWALYQLFAIWDPEEARNKLQPFFPPLEPLQSLNLRTALFRCLDQAKKNGILGRDAVLRKTMLDECKGERLEEVLAVFSNAVLKKVLQDGQSEQIPLAQQIALENFSYTGERSTLSALIVVHRASLSRHLRQKEESRAKYRDFAELLKLNERRVARRHEQLKQALEENRSTETLSDKEVKEIQDKAYANWSGNPEWLESILFGDSKQNGEGLLMNQFEKVWMHVEDGSIGDIEGQSQVGLLEQLSARIKDQESRLARWQDFGKTLTKGLVSSPSRKKEPASIAPNKIDLGFIHHQALQVGRNNSEKVTRSNNSASLEEYTRLVQNMKSELGDVGKPRTRQRPPRRSLTPQKPVFSPVSIPEELAHKDAEDDWASASDSELLSPAPTDTTKPTLQTPPSEKLFSGPEPKSLYESHIKRISTPQLDPSIEFKKPTPPKAQLSPRERIRTPPMEAQEVEKTVESDIDLADQILNSVSASSPSPKKPRQTLSLAERTRLSMSRAHSQLPDLQDDHMMSELPRLSLKSRPSLAPRAMSSESESGLHADLVERTRKSMAGFEAAQKKAQLDRRRSMKEAKKKTRESTYFPKVEEEVFEPDVSTIELIEGDPDYESVFKSRPKIATSPAVSPTRIWGEVEE